MKADTVLACKLRWNSSLEYVKSQRKFINGMKMLTKSLGGIWMVKTLPP